MTRKTIITYTDEELKELNTIAEKLDDLGMSLCRLIKDNDCDRCSFKKWCEPLEDVKTAMFNTIEDIVNNNNQQEMEEKM